MGDEYEKKVSVSGFSPVVKENPGRGRNYNILSAEEKRPEHKKTVRQGAAQSARGALKSFATDKLLRNTAICAVCALVVFGIANSDSKQAQKAEDTIKEVVAYEFDEDDIGMLKFVDSSLEEDARLVMSEQEAFVYPLDGIVTTTFAQNGSGAIITAMESTEVMASRSGTVNVTSDNFLSITQNDGSITTYFGVAPKVAQGDTVETGQIIGELLSDTLYVEQNINGEKIDPFA